MEYFSVLEGTSSESIRKASQMIANVLEEVDIQCTTSIDGQHMFTLLIESFDMLIYLFYNNEDNSNVLCLVLNMIFYIGNLVLIHTVHR